MNFDKLIGQLSRDWEWLSFVAQYCAGRNIDKPVCEDFMWWALGAAALVVVIVAWWILGKIAKVYTGVKPTEHSEQVLKDLAELKKS